LICDILNAMYYIRYKIVFYIISIAMLVIKEIPEKSP
jgi:hypothetical protein